MTNNDKTLCNWWELHHWGPWEQVHETIIEPEGYADGEYTIIQKRVCKKCGFTKLNKQSQIIS
jgi:hypothetical protein